MFIYFRYRVNDRLKYGLIKGLVYWISEFFFLGLFIRIKWFKESLF